MLASLLVAAAAPAQVFVSPAHFTNAEGSLTTTVPFGSAQVPYRYLQIHGDVPAMTISGLAFRWEGAPTGVFYPPFSLTLDAWISTAARTAATASPTFDTNHGGDKVQVAVHQTIAVPGSDPSQLPSPFVLDIPFTAPFVFAGTPASLCWEVQITARTNPTDEWFDGAYNDPSIAANPPLFSTRAFTGCLATGNAQPMTIATSLGPMNWPAGTGTAVDSASQLLHNGAILWAFGFDRVSWGGLPLPITVPGSAGAPSGACNLLIDIAMTQFAIASAAGGAQLSLGFHVQPGLHGARFYEQVFGLDQAANPFGVTASNLVVHQIVAPYPYPLPICRVIGAGSLGASGVVDTTGNVITRFR
jgi:hypothetical protein